jgi:uncharacterized membrane protein
VDILPGDAHSMIAERYELSVFETVGVFGGVLFVVVLFIAFCVMIWAMFAGYFDNKVMKHKEKKHHKEVSSGLAIFQPEDEEDEDDHPR